MDLHPGEEVVFEGHPSWRALLSFYVGGVAGAIAIAIVVALLASVVAGLLTGAALVAAVLGYGLFERMSTVYLVSTQRLYIRRGLLSKHVQQTRIDRVQNVNTDQSLRERVLRVGTVDFDTAASDDSEFKFVGIASPGEVVSASTARSATRPPPDQTARGRGNHPLEVTPGHPRARNHPAVIAPAADHVRVERRVMRGEHPWRG